MDMHSIIVSSISDEPLFTAEQVGRASFTTQDFPLILTVITGESLSILWLR